MSENTAPKICQQKPLGEVSGSSNFKYNFDKKTHQYSELNIIWIY